MLYIFKEKSFLEKITNYQDEKQDVIMADNKYR